MSFNNQSHSDRRKGYYAHAEQEKHLLLLITIFISPGFPHEPIRIADKCVCQTLSYCCILELSLRENVPIFPLNNTETALSPADASGSYLQSDRVNMLFSQILSEASRTEWAPTKGPRGPLSFCLHAFLSFRSQP